MFLGEALCYVVFKAWYFWRHWNNQDLSIFGDQKFNPFIWAIPAMCDLIGTSIMYVGLTWTYAASFQMLKGSVIIFTSLLSVAFLVLIWMKLLVERKKTFINSLVTCHKDVQVYRAVFLEWTQNVEFNELECQLKVHEYYFLKVFSVLSLSDPPPHPTPHQIYISIILTP